MRRVPRAGRATPGDDAGAAAVEFALLLPIFALLTVGMLSGGLTIWHTIATTQASRDAARLGSTTPIAKTTPPATGDVPIDEWLRRTMFTALQGAGWVPASEASVAATNLNRAGEKGYACVAYVQGNTGAQGSRRLVLGSPAGGEYGPNPSAPGSPEDGPCYTDNPSLTSARVQVVIHRQERWNLIVAAPTFDVYSQGNVPYERSIP